MISRSRWLHVCKSTELSEGNHVTINLIWNGKIQPGLIFRFNQGIYAYINRCVHMPKKLNCQKNVIFDESGKYLRCSMHGIVYNPETGASESTLCNGIKLQAVKVVEDDGNIYITDKRVSVEDIGLRPIF